MRKPAGSIVTRKGVLKARIIYSDPATGKRREIERAVRTRSEARDTIDRVVRELNETDGRSGPHERKRFSDLAAYYAGVYLRPAEYRDGRKIAGLRGLKSAQNRINVLIDYFGARTLRSLTYGDFLRFKEVRLATPTVRRGPRAIASVHRELELLRRIFSVAVREGWLLRNPFNAGDALISKADEKQRERILTAEEERRLLKAAEHPFRKHLRPVLICAIDTGMRLGEILKLQWSDIDLFGRTIVIRAFNTKTLQARSVSMTARLHQELVRLTEGGIAPEQLIFGIVSNVKRSFVSARNEAGLQGLRFHDLRHTAATRLCAGLPLPEVGRILGHQQPSTTYRYINANGDTAKRAATILDKFNFANAEAGQAAELAN